MKRIFLLILIIANASCALASECTNYLKEVQSQSCNKKVKVVSKVEFNEEYQQMLGDEQITSITCGSGYIKIKGRKKKNISYVCLLNKDCKPVWGYIIP